jgi:hypothetical protein
VVDRLLLDDTGYLNLPNVSGSKADTPDHADFGITGDIDIRALVASTDWTPASTQISISQNNTTGSQAAWQFRLDSAGTLTFTWSVLGTGTTNSTSTVGVPDIAGQPLWIRVTMDVDNGAVGNDVKFYTSAEAVTTDPASVTWTQLGATVTTAGITSIFDSSSVVTVGTTANNASRWIGNIYYAEVRNGIGGTIVANPDFRDIDQQNSSTQLTDDHAKVWTVRGSASWHVPALPEDRYLLEDGSSILLLESSVPDDFIPYTSPMPQLLAQ